MEYFDYADYTPEQCEFLNEMYQGRHLITQEELENEQQEIADYMVREGYWFEQRPVTKKVPDYLLPAITGYEIWRNEDRRLGLGLLGLKLRPSLSRAA